MDSESFLEKLDRKSSMHFSPIKTLSLSQVQILRHTPTVDSPAGAS